MTYDFCNSLSGNRNLTPLPRFKTNPCYLLFFQEGPLVGENVPGFLGINDIPEGGHDISSPPDDVDEKGLIPHLPGLGVGEVRRFFHEGGGGDPVSVSLDSMALDAEPPIDFLSTDRIAGRPKGQSPLGKNQSPSQNRPDQDDKSRSFYRVV